MNSVLITGFGFAAVAQPVAMSANASRSAGLRPGTKVENIQPPINLRSRPPLDVGRWMLDVGCFLKMFMASMISKMIFPATDVELRVTIAVHDDRRLRT